MKNKTEIKYELKNMFAEISRKWMSVKEYWERKLLDEIWDYIIELK